MIGHEHFPYQQGRLDWLCSVYSVINLLVFRGGISDEDAAGIVFNKLIDDIDKNGDLAKTVTNGVHREDVLYFLKVLGHKSKKLNNPLKSDLIAAAEAGAIIFVKSLDEDFTHYTVVHASRSADTLELFDSYGFQQLCCRRGIWFMSDGNAEVRVEILNLYA